MRECIIHPSIHLFASGNMAHITAEKLDRRQTDKNSAKTVIDETRFKYENSRTKLCAFDVSAECCACG